MRMTKARISRGPKIRRIRALSLSLVAAVLLVVYYGTDATRSLERASDLGPDSELVPDLARFYELEDLVEDTPPLISECATWRPEQNMDLTQPDDPLDCLRATQYRQVERSLRREESNQ